jgi:hypothetical protein
VYFWKDGRGKILYYSFRWSSAGVAAALPVNSVNITTTFKRNFASLDVDIDDGNAIADRKSLAMMVFVLDSMDAFGFTSREKVMRKSCNSCHLLLRLHTTWNGL